MKVIEKILPIYILIDTSCEQEVLNWCMNQFVIALDNNLWLRERMDICVISYDACGIEIHNHVPGVQFTTVKLNANKGAIPDFDTVLNSVLDDMSERKILYRKMGISYYKPYLFSLVTNAYNLEYDLGLSNERLIRLLKDKKIKYSPMEYVTDSKIRLIRMSLPFVGISVKNEKLYADNINFEIEEGDINIPDYIGLINYEGYRLGLKLGNDGNADVYEVVGDEKIIAKLYKLDNVSEVYKKNLEKRLYAMLHSFDQRNDNLWGDCLIDLLYCGYCKTFVGCILQIIPESALESTKFVKGNPNLFRNTE